MTMTTWKGEKHKAVEVSLLYILQDLMETPVSPAATGGDADCLHNKSLAAHPPPSPFYISTSATKSSFKWSSTLILKASSKQHCTCHNIFIQTHVRFVVLTEPESHQLSLQKVFQNRNRQTSGSIDHTSGSNKKGKTNVTKHMYFEQTSGNLNMKTRWWWWQLKPKEGWEDFTMLQI